MLSYPKMIILMLMLPLVLTSCKKNEVITNGIALNNIEEMQDKDQICPDCREYSVISEYEFSDAEITEEFCHCRICGTRGSTIQRTYVFRERCSNTCGYDTVSDTNIQYGIQCPVEDTVWMTYLKYSDKKIYEPVG